MFLFFNRYANPFTVLLLHADTDFSDSSTNTTMSLSGATLPAISATQTKFGAGSIAFTNITAQSVLTPSSSKFFFGTRDFTVECWVYFNSLPSSGVASIFGTMNGTNPIDIYYTPGSLVYNGNGFVSKPSAGITTGAWHHVAICRTGTTFYGFYDGTLVGSWTSSAIIGGASPDQVAIGASGLANTSLSGYIDEVRVTIGTNFYTGPFTVPNAPFI